MTEQQIVEKKYDLEILKLKLQIKELELNIEEVTMSKEEYKEGLGKSNENV